MVINKSTSVKMAFFKAAILPNPYKGMNSKKYDWIETSV